MHMRILQIICAHYKSICVLQVFLHITNTCISAYYKHLCISQYISLYSQRASETCLRGALRAEPEHSQGFSVHGKRVSRDLALTPMGDGQSGREKYKQYGSLACTVLYTVQEIFAGVFLHGECNLRCLARMSDIMLKQDVLVFVSYVILFYVLVRP